MNTKGIKISLVKPSESSNRESRQTSTGIGQHGTAGAHGAMRDRDRDQPLSPDDSEQLDGDAQRDNNQSALDKEYYNVVADAAAWMQAADDS